jgi:hypothetical protein
LGYGIKNNIFIKVLKFLGIAKKPPTTKVILPLITHVPIFFFNLLYIYIYLFVMGDTCHKLIGANAAFDGI